MLLRPDAEANLLLVKSIATNRLSLLDRSIIIRGDPMAEMIGPPLTIYQGLRPRTKLSVKQSEESEQEKYAVQVV